MAQHDYNIEDQNGFDFLVDLNNALSAIATNNAGPSEPNPTFANMLWLDTNNDLMKMRNEANSAWVVVAKKDGSGWTPYRQGTALGTASVLAIDAPGTAPLFACRAWVNFNGTGTVAIRASGNVSSITDNGTGDYTVNFTTAMPDENYAMSGSGEDNDNRGDVTVGRPNGGTKTSTACRIKTLNTDNFAKDYPSVEVMFFR